MAFDAAEADAAGSGDFLHGQAVEIAKDNDLLFHEGQTVDSLFEQ